MKTKTIKRSQVKINKKEASIPKKIDFLFLTLILATLAVGLLMLFSASYADAYTDKGDSFHYIKNQIIFAGVGIVGMIIITFLDYRFWKVMAKPIYFICLGLLFVTLLMPSRSDYKRWIQIGPIGLQPSEIAKFSLIIMCAYLIDVIGNERMKTLQYGVINIGLRILPSIMLVLFARHISGTIILVLLTVIMMFAGGTRKRWFILLAIVGAILAYLVINLNQFDYAMDRITIWRDPTATTDTADGYQILQSLYAVSSGGLTGLGIGNSRQKFKYLPELQNDYIFPIVSEELGFIGASLIVLLFMAIVIRGFYIAMKAEDTFGKLVAVGISTQIALQAFLNIAVATNTLPSTGISLPFFSSGGTAIMMLLGEVGVLLSISRHSNTGKKVVLRKKDIENEGEKQ